MKKKKNNDMLKTTSMVSMMFGLLATDKDKELAQTKIFVRGNDD